MRLMSPFISMDKRNFLNGRYVCIVKLQFIPAAFIPAQHLVQLQFEQKMRFIYMQFCRKCNVPIYFNMRRMRATKNQSYFILKWVVVLQNGNNSLFYKTYKSL